MIAAALVLAIGLFESAPTAPHVVNGQLVTHAASGDLAAQVASFTGPSWAGYRVSPAVPRRCQWCCDQPQGNTAFLEGEREAFILIRTDGRLTVLSPSCEIDLGGLTLHWIDGVTSVASIQFLKSARRDHREVVSAIAAHADPVADQFLYQTANSKDEPRDARERAAFWLAATRGAAGFNAVAKLAQSDPDKDLRPRLMSALYQAPEFAGTPLLIELAVHDPERKVRERAFFWLGRSKDPRAMRFIEEVLAK